MTVTRSGEVYEELRENREATVHTAIWGRKDAGRSRSARHSGLGSSAMGEMAADGVAAERHGESRPLRAVDRAFALVSLRAASVMHIRSPEGGKYVHGLTSTSSHLACASSSRRCQLSQRRWAMPATYGVWIKSSPAPHHGGRLDRRTARGHCGSPRSGRTQTVR